MANQALYAAFERMWQHAVLKINENLSASQTYTDKKISSHSHDYLPISGGTLTGNLTGKHISGTWLQTTSASDKTGNFATIDESGWVYYRKPSEVLSDIGAAAQSHVHNYAGSSSAGGAATSALKLTTNAGSANTPVYFVDGIPKACTSLNIAQGGTGATTAADARTNLGAAASSDLAKYLPLTGGTLTGGLTVSSGNLSFTSTNGSVRIENSAEKDTGILTANATRKALFYVSAAGNAGIYDVTNSNWILRSDTSKNIYFPTGNINISGNASLAGNANNIRFGIGVNNATYVQLRQTGNASTGYYCAFVHYDANSDPSYYNIFNPSGEFMLAPYNYLISTDRVTRAMMSSDDNLIPQKVNGDKYAGKCNLGSGDHYWLSLYYSGSLSKQSDARSKNILGDLSEDDSLVLLKGSDIKKFTYKTDDNSIVHYGVIAQDVRDLLINSDIGYNSLLSIVDKKTDKPVTDIYAPEDSVSYAIDYTQYAPILIKGWQNHETRIEALERENRMLREQLENLK